MLYMLQRTSLLERRKKKKTEFEKIVQTVKGKIELDLRSQNKKSDDDFVELDKLDPRTTKFQIQEDFKTTLPALLKALTEYVTQNNEYINVKALEDKTKVGLIN